MHILSGWKYSCHQLLLRLLYREAAYCVRSVWSTQHRGNRQWYMFYQLGVHYIPLEEWYITSAPYHPSSNGLAERVVQSFKQGMRKFTKGTLTDRISRYLFHYRNTPHTTTGVTPAELLLGRRPHSRLDVVQPDHVPKCLKSNRSKPMTCEPYSVSQLVI